MAGEFNLDVASIASTTMDGLSQSVYPLMGTLLFIAVVIFVVWYSSHRHRVLIRFLNSGGNGKPVEDKAREVVVDGVIFWKLLKRKHIIPVPPAEAITPLPSKGKHRFYAEFSWSEETGYVPLIYDVNTSNFSKKVITHHNGETLTGAFQPFTPQQRSLFVGQLRKAEARKRKDIWDKISQIATPLVLAMLFLSVLLFWEDIAKPAKEMSELNLQMQSKNTETITQMAEISNQLARITNELTGSDITVEQKVGG